MAFAPIAIEETRRKELAKLAERLRAAEPALGSTEPFGARAGRIAGPTLFLGDAPGIPFLDSRGGWALEYRALLLAGDGDAVALGLRRNPAFEAYAQDVLRLGHPRILTPARLSSPRPSSVAARCASDPAALGALVALARKVSRLNVVPYLGNGAAWVLAGRIAAKSGSPVRVAAPPPRLARRANDKLWFARRLHEVLGPRALPPTFPAYGPAALAGRVASLARHHPFVAIKVPDSAGALGNLVIESAGLRSLDVARVRDRLLALLGPRRSDRYPLLISVWDCPVLMSPSVQLWIPLREEGAPIVQGIFDQAVRGIEGEFCGAEPSELPDPWRPRLVQEAVQMGCLFQELGYYGACSLDAVLTGGDLNGAELHWVECNARWGGVSIPIAIMDRLVGRWTRQPFVVVDRTDLELPRRPFAWVLERFRDRVLGSGGGEGGLLFLSPGRFEDGRGFQFLAAGRDLPEARRRAAEAVEILLDANERP
ncbi:MAG: hypothetical protein ABFS46_06095 [Myxococcota bacterium]